MRCMRKPWFILGSSLLLVLAASYFIRFSIDGGSNFLVQDRLLGILIFHNPFVLALYALLGIACIIRAYLP